MRCFRETDLNTTKMITQLGSRQTVPLGQAAAGIRCSSSQNNNCAITFLSGNFLPNSNQQLTDDLRQRVIPFTCVLDANLFRGNKWDLLNLLTSLMYLFFLCCFFCREFKSQFLKPFFFPEKLLSSRIEELLYLERLGHFLQTQD